MICFPRNVTLSSSTPLGKGSVEGLGAFSTVRRAVVLLSISLSILACKQEPKKTIKTEPVVFKKEGELSIYKQATDSLTTKFDIEIAETDYETETGLMYRQAMDRNHGMLFIFPDVAMHSFYMKNTEFPLDLLFITADFKIGSLQENAKPLDERGLSSKVPIKYVLEINAGMVQQLLLQVGDSISYKKTGS